MSDWTEYHVYLHGRRATDVFVRDVLPAVLRVVGPRWWFVRYWLGGPHLRVRVPSASASDAIMVALQAAVAELTTCPAIEREAFYANCGFDGAAVDVATLPWFADGEVRRANYQPETDFYGAGADLARNEALFCASSQLAVRLLGAVNDDPQYLAPIAADLLTATVGRSGPAREIAFLDAYRLFLAPFGAAPHGRFVVPSSPGAPGTAWAAALVDFEALGDQPVRRLVLQHHLLINRIGLSPRQEAGIFNALHREVVHG